MRNLWEQFCSIIKQIFQKDFFVLFMSNMSIQLFAFIAQLLIAKIVSPDDVGRIKVLATYISIATFIGGMGFNISTLKLCAEHASKKHIAQIVNSALVFTILSSTIVYGIILIGNYFSLINSDLVIRTILPLALLPIILQNIFLVYLAAFQGSKHLQIFSWLQLSHKAIFSIAIIIASYVWGIWGYYSAFSMSLLIIIGVSIFVFQKQYTWIKPKNLIESFRQHKKYAGISTITSIITEVSAYLDILFISWFITNMHEVGYYGFALTLTVALRLFPATIQQITVPYFSQVPMRKIDFFKIFKTYQSMLFLGIGIAYIFFTILVPPAISYFYNNAYQESIPYIYILAITWSIREAIQVQASALFGLGYIRYNMYASLISFGVNCIAYPIALHLYGMQGLAYATIISAATLYISSRLYLQKAIKTL